MFIEKRVVLAKTEPSDSARLWANAFFNLQNGHSLAKAAGPTTQRRSLRLLFRDVGLLNVPSM